MKKQRFLVFALIVVIAVFAFGITGCGGSPDELESISITTAPTKTAYYVGEKFDPTGMVVTATYGDGSTKAVTDYTVDKTGTLSATDEKITVTYEGKTATQDISVGTLSDISITKAPDKTTYEAGEKFDPKGMVVTATYSNGVKSIVTDYTIDKKGMLKATDKTISVTYENKTVVQNILVIGIVGLKVNKAPKTDYIVGETFDPTGMEVVVDYSDDRTETVTDYEYDKKEPLTTEDTAVTITYENYETVLPITVGELSAVEITEKPAKTLYQVGETFDKTGLKAEAVYSNGIRIDVTDECTLDKDGALSWNDDTVTVAYEDKTAVFDINVVDVAVTGKDAVSAEAETLDPAAWVKADAEKDFIADDETAAGGKYLGNLAEKSEVKTEFYIAENSTVKIEGTFRGDAEYALADNVVFKVDGYSLKAPEVAFDGTWKTVNFGNYLFNAGAHTFTMTVNEKAPDIDKFGFTLTEEGAEKQAIGMEITAAPTKTRYVEGEKFNSEGMEVVMRYNDFTSETVTDYTIDKTEALTLEDTSVTVSKDGFTATQPIEVRAADIAFSTSGAYIVEAENLDQGEWIIQPGREGMQIETPSNPTSGGKSVGSLSAGSKVKAYINAENEVNVKLTAVLAQIGATYNLKANVKFSIDGKELIPDDVTFGSSPEAQYTNWKNVPFAEQFMLDAGLHVFTMEIVGEGINIDCFKFDVVDPSDAKILKSIEITEQPDKTAYNFGETFDKTGMVVTAVYDNNGEEVREVVEGYTVSPSGTLKPSITQVTVEFMGKTATVDITVSGNVKIATPDNSADKLIKMSDDGNYIEIDRSGKAMFATGTDYVLIGIYASPDADVSSPLGTLKFEVDNKPFENGMNVGGIKTMDDSKEVRLNGGPGNYFISLVGPDAVNYDKFMELIAYAVGESYSADSSYYLACKVIAESEPVVVDGESITFEDSEYSVIGNFAWKAN